MIVSFYLVFLCVKSVFLREEGSVAGAGLEIPLRVERIAADFRRSAETFELRRVRPAEMGRGRIDLVEFRQIAKAVVLTEAVKVMGAFDGRGKASGIMVAHMYPRLVDVAGAHEGFGIALQHQHPLPPLAAAQRAVQPVQAGADHDLIEGVHDFPRPPPALRQ